ncbi:ORC1-type DNA replication protein [archaeon]|mgnify:CR=1 FL=1|jgi:archaeal cell division control protein 6|nr:ORC1-type DNA replication protein [archaeon]MBT4272114.1 ORC1-type DNA replication protein [archaeon]MBT4461735.1 ORC1-type DNA replication protein [archaeon]MBT4858817.1 ORC1-type DNA replication protein [archaeon]MBT5423088.1 ORC1-type DNA replication protein [archaeon]
MNQKGLTGYFEKFIDENLIFKNKKSLQTTYTPESILHRDHQINEVASILAPALKEEKPSNLFIYGKTGTGKTLTIKHITQNMFNIANQRNISMKTIYLNCKMKRIADTEYRIIAQIIKELGEEVPYTGLPTDEVYNKFFRIIKKTNTKTMIILLDEIDQLIKKAGDEVIYNLTRINSELPNIQISLVGISNNLLFTDNMDPRVRSSLSEEEIVFPPYNALQLQDILKKRSDEAFIDGVIENGVIAKCAAYSAREHGDARRALELLRVAGELAERAGISKVRIDHIDRAEEKIEKERILEIVKTQPKQSQVTLLSLIHLLDKNKRKIFTGDVYELYKKLCTKTDLRPLTQRRISDIIGELDMLGIINATVISKGRYGRTREINSDINNTLKQKIKAILSSELNL